MSNVRFSWSREIMEIAGSVIIVTGASRGIGRCLTTDLIRRGANVVLVGRNKQRLDEALVEIHPLKSDSVSISADVTVRSSVSRMVEEVIARFGKIDVLVNNAGGGSYGAFLDVASTKLPEYMNLNFWGTVNCIEAVLPDMFEKGKGTIVNMGALDGKFGLAGDTVGASTKAAVIALSEALHLELKPHGIHVALVNPSAVATPGFSQEFENAESWHAIKTLHPEAVSSAVVKAIERNAIETNVPGSSALFVILRHALPGLFRWIAARKFPGPGESINGR